MLPNKKKLELIASDAKGQWVDQYRAAIKLMKTDAKKGEQALLDIVLQPIPQKSESESETDEVDPIIVKEAAIYDLVKAQATSASVEKYTMLIHAIRPIFFSIPKTRTARIIRNFLDLLSSISNATEIQEFICKDTIAWCIQEKRTFLRHRLETRLAFVYLQLRKFTAGLELVKNTIKEVKKLDDKLLLVELHYAETRLYFELNNLSKAKTALTSARSNANAIHCPPVLQAHIDVMSGAIHLEDTDSKTAYSYFIEAYEAYHNAQHPKALDALKYAMLSKIMTEQPKEVLSMATNRQYLQYSGTSMDVVKTIAQSYVKKDLKIFEDCLKENKEELSNDPIFSRHINRLYQSLLEKNILRVLKLYSSVEVSHVAKLLDLTLETTQEKLSQMILDKVLDGTLDQENGILQLYRSNEVPSIYGDILAIIANLSSVVDVLASKAQITI